jgi:hypothetical protein
VLISRGVKKNQSTEKIKKIKETLTVKTEPRWITD